MSLPCFISPNRMPKKKKNASNATGVRRLSFDQYWKEKRQKPIKHQASCRLIANQFSYRHRVQMHWWKLKLREDKGKRWGIVNERMSLNANAGSGWFASVVHIELCSVNLCSINACILYAVSLHRPQVIFNIKYQVFKIANCCSGIGLEI